MRRTYKKERDCLQPSIAYFYYFIQFIAICSSGPYIVKVKQKIIGIFIWGFAENTENTASVLRPCIQASETLFKSTKFYKFRYFNNHKWCLATH